MAGLTLASPSAERRPAWSPWRETWRRYRRHKLAVVSAVLLLVLIVAVVFGPFVWRVSINDIDFNARLEGPSLAHPFGTDDLGQDILARMIYGGRISLAVGLAAMAVAVLVGTLIGALAGMSRGALGHALMWLTDLFLSLPQLPLLLLLIYLFRDGLKAAFGPEGGIFILIVLVIGGLRWMPVARLVRAQFLSLREKDFVEAARALGASPLRQVVRHILPNALGPVIIAGTIDVAAAIIAESTLVFSRPRLPARRSDLGPAAVRRQGLSRHRRPLGAVSGRRDLRRGRRHQFHRRRHARRARCKAGDLMSPLLEIKGLKTHFATDDGMLQGGRRRRHRAQQGRDALRGRRIRLRQDRHGDVDPEADRDAAGPHRRRPDPVRGPRSRAAHQPRTGRHQGQGDRLHLPGADDLAQPGADDRRADRRKPAPPRGPVEKGRAGPHHRDAEAGADSQCGRPRA